MPKISRRKLILATCAIGAGAILGGLYASISSRQSIAPLEPTGDTSKVYIVKGEDRSACLKTLLEHFSDNIIKGESVAIKSNFNSPDPFPGTTHLGTLEAIINVLKDEGIKEINLAERSGAGNTRRNLENLGVFDLAKKYGVNVTVLDELDKNGWVQIPADGTHWIGGFSLAKIFVESRKVIQTCCLKTHRFGGHFTMSLKNSVGLVAKSLPDSIYDYMTELHTSPFQRTMIAEINRFYKVDLVIMDAMKAFVSGGPDRGTIAEPGVMLASTDRVAIDAVGVAILRMLGSTKEVMEGGIFDQEQIRRAAELGIGVNSAEKIDLIPVNNASEDIADRVRTKLQ
ncbi:MAG: DUF362 domain-containing protein [Methanocellales archaeon]|nr:DUF362 domain-containing protein [Methanocellales archaeon]MDD4898301.1 DUF362 domain-containing protein [Methanocellales archaeon]